MTARLISFRSLFTGPRVDLDLRILRRRWPLAIKLVATLALLSGVASRAEEALPPLPVKDAAFDQKMAWWREARFGCFVHWGPSAVLGNEWRGQKGGTYAEHIQRVLKISMADYKADAVDKFNPTGFNADEWMALVRRAGMRYFVITAKHHDGYAMYDSAVSDYNIVKQSPWHRDPMAELKAAADRVGIKFGFYYSHAFDWGDQHAPGNDWEWQNPGGDRCIAGGARWWENNPEKLKAVARDYVDAKSIPQIQELIRNYHPALMWFDTPSKLPFSENYRILQAVRAADPTVIVNGRLARTAQENYGDYLSTGDRAVEFNDRAEDWEAIPTTNESYGWNPLDFTHKTPAFLLETLAKAVARGGNILLNIGPMADGRIDPRDVAILEGIGQWMDFNAESIHGCGRAGLPVQPWGVVTARGNRLYLHVFDWPQDRRLVIGGLVNTPERATLLKDLQLGPLAISRLNAQDVVLTLPARPADPCHIVIALDLGAPPVAAGLRRISATARTNQLLAFDATRHRDGQTGDATGLGYGDGKRDRYYITRWTDTAQWLEWEFRLDAPAEFEVVITYAKGSGSGVFAVNCGEWSAARRVSADAAADVSQRDSLGTIRLPAGEHRLELRALKIDGTEHYQTTKLEDSGLEIFRPLSLELRPVDAGRTNGKATSRATSSRDPNREAN